MGNEKIKLSIEEAEKYKSLMDPETSAIYYLIKYSKKYRQHNNINHLEINKDLYNEWKTKIK